MLGLKGPTYEKPYLVGWAIAHPLFNDLRVKHNNQGFVDCNAILAMPILIGNGQLPIALHLLKAKNEVAFSGPKPMNWGLTPPIHWILGKDYKSILPGQQRYWGQRPQ